MELRPKFVSLVIIALSMVGAGVVVHSADRALGWSSAAGSVSAFLGSGQVQPKAVEVDANGNIYSAGIVNAATDFDPSPSAAFTLTPGSANFTGYVAKMNSEGELLWAGLVTGSGSSFISDLSLDSSGNILLLGHFTGTVDLDPGSGTTSVTSSSSGAQTNLFAIRLTTTGVLSWSHTLPVLSYGYSIDVDPNDNFVMTGEFAGSNVDFHPGVGTDTLSNGGNGVFVWSITSTGTHRWVNRATGTYTNSRAVATDSLGNVYICGTYQGATTDFDPGAGVANEASASNSQDFYLWSLDQNGSYRWVTTFGNSNPESCYALEVSASGNVLVSGSFYTSIDLGRDSSNEVTAVTGEDFYFGMYDTNGVNQWIYGRDSSSVAAFAFSGSSVWMAGSFFGTIDFDPGVGTTNLVSRGSSDVFVSKFNTSGVFQSAFRFGGSDGQETVSSIALTGGDVYLTGYFGSRPANFNTDSGIAVNVSSTGTFSGYVNKLTSMGSVLVPTTTTTTTTTTAPPVSSTTVAPPTSAPVVTTTTGPGVLSPSTSVAGGPQGSGGKGSLLETTTTTSVIATTTTVKAMSPDVASVQTGEVGATVGGSPAVVTLSDVNGEVVATVDGATVSYSVTAPDGSKRAVSVSSFSAIRAGDKVKLTLNGFKSSGKANAWITPTGVSIGEASLIEGNGTLEGTIPNDVAEGDIRIVTAAESSEGEFVVLAYGVMVEGEPSQGTPWSWILFVVVGLAVVGGFLIPAARRRTRKS